MGQERLAPGPVNRADGLGRTIAGVILGADHGRASPPPVPLRGWLACNRACNSVLCGSNPKASRCSGPPGSTGDLHTRETPRHGAGYLVEPLQPLGGVVVGQRRADHPRRGQRLGHALGGSEPSLKAEWQWKLTCTDPDIACRPSPMTAHHAPPWPPHADARCRPLMRHWQPARCLASHTAAGSSSSSSVFSGALGVSSDTTTSVRKLSGIEKIAGLLKGIGAVSGSSP